MGTHFSVQCQFWAGAERRQKLIHNQRWVQKWTDLELWVAKDVLFDNGDQTWLQAMDAARHRSGSRENVRQRELGDEPPYAPSTVGSHVSKSAEDLCAPMLGAGMKLFARLIALCVGMILMLGSFDVLDGSHLDAAVCWNEGSLCKPWFLDSSPWLRAAAQGNIMGPFDRSTKTRVPAVTTSATPRATQRRLCFFTEVGRNLTIDDYTYIGKCKLPTLLECNQFNSNVFAGQNTLYVMDTLFSLTTHGQQSIKRVLVDSNSVIK